LLYRGKIVVTLTNTAGNDTACNGPGLIASKRPGVPQIHGFRNGYHVGHLLRQFRSAASQHECGGNQQTRGNRGSEHEPPLARMVFSPQGEQPPHATGAVRCMIDSGV
jgi:hypothetical protein